MSPLGLSGKTTVGISLSVNNRLELVCIDKITKKLTQYASTNAIHYNSAQREIVDIDEFSDALRTLFDEAEIDLKRCNVILNLPNVHFALTDKDSAIGKENLTDNLVGDAEEIYLFRRETPAVSWSILSHDAENNIDKVVYGAIQEAHLSAIVSTMSELGMTVIGVETSYSALLKGLQYTGYIKEDSGNSTILLITSNSYCILSLRGTLINSFTEEPLAIKSYSNTEVYDIIAETASLSLSNFEGSNLIVLSETDDINAEMLLPKLNFNGNMQPPINRNKFSEDSIIDISENASIIRNQIPYISFEAIGVAASKYDKYPVSFNFIPDSKYSDDVTITILGHEMPLLIFCIGLVISTIIILLILWFICFGILNSKSEDLKAEIVKMRKQSDNYQAIVNKDAQGGTTNIYNIVKEIKDGNEKTFNMFNALSTRIPSTIWINKFKASSDGSLIIMGNAQDNNQIDAFLAGLKEYDENVLLSQINFDSNDPGSNATYSFEIKNANNTNIFGEEYAEQNPNTMGDIQTILRNNEGNINTNNAPKLAPPPAPIN